ncbi:MAG TPA: hypothetical protein VI977_04895 [archaeon]|nr:hypothetical protein [archaeon]
MKKIFLFLAVIALAGIVHAQTACNGTAGCGPELRLQEGSILGEYTGPPYIDASNVLFCKTGTQELVIAVNVANPEASFEGKISLVPEAFPGISEQTKTQEIANGAENWILFGYNATILRELDGDYSINASLYNETTGATLEETFFLKITNNCSGLSISSTDIPNPAYNEGTIDASATITNSGSKTENIKVRFDITDSAGKIVLENTEENTEILSGESKMFFFKNSTSGIPEGIYTANIVLYSIVGADETVVARQSQKIAIANSLKKFQNVPETNSFGIMIVLFGVLSLFAISRKQEKA